MRRPLAASLAVTPVLTRPKLSLCRPNGRPGRRGELG